jgi:hypothetical protein
LKLALENNPGFDLILTGHSLGAGTAELITLSILSELSKRANHSTKYHA